MSKMLVAGAASLAVLGAATGGYRMGAGSWPGPMALWEPRVSATTNAIPRQSERRVLYWKDPDGKNDFSPTPKMAGDGRAYLPVYEDEEAGFKDAKLATTAKGESRKILYYRNPMGLADTSAAPKKDWMGMDYIPVYEGEEQDVSSVKVSLDRIQRAGVRTEEVQPQRLTKPVRAPGVAKPDERTLRAVVLRADGFIEKLYVNQTGQHVTAGEPLFRVYSQELLRALIDYRTSVGTGVLTPEQRLHVLEIPQNVIDEVKRGKPIPMAFDYPAPVSGVVMEKMAIEGQMMRTGEPLYRLTDLSSIWVIADVPEQDIGLVKVGAPAKVNFRAYPNEPFQGRVTFILHELDPATRTGKVRIEVKNPDHRIKHEMYADVEIDAGIGDGEVLAVPVSSVIDSGNRQVVIVERGEGRFEPRSVRLGQRGADLVEIREGLKAGERIVVTANFLIDAESNLRAALQAFTGDQQGSSPAGVADPKLEKAR
jgi:Cu(I)/Ag(I) efflux system membrane fusion protein